MIERLSEQSMSEIVRRLLKFHDPDYKFKFAQELDKLKIAYETTPEGFARDVILGTYHLMSKKWEHNYGHPFENVLHRRIQRDVLDRLEITRWNKRRIYGEHIKR